MHSEGAAPAPPRWGEDTLAPAAVFVVINIVQFLFNVARDHLRAAFPAALAPNAKSSLYRGYSKLRTHTAPRVVLCS